MQNNKRKSPTNTPKSKRKTINETTVLDSEGSIEDDGPIIVPKVTFRDTPQDIPMPNNPQNTKKKTNNLMNFVNKSQRSISKMFAKKVVHESSPNIDEPFTPSPIFEEPSILREPSILMSILRKCLKYPKIALLPWTFHQLYR